MEVFWQKGYEGASLPDLTAAMGINRPSLYAAFGNKESLFRKALNIYSVGYGSYMQQALAEPTARAAAEKLLLGAVDLLTHPCHPAGCLLVQGALVCGDSADCVRKELASRRAEGEALIRRRFKRAISTGDLPAGSDANSLARLMTTLIFGMAVHAGGGASRAELRRVARLALKAWPG